MKIKILIVLLLIMSSCKVLKDKKDVELTKTEIKESKRKGDTLSYIVPNVKYKDTTIYVKNFEKSGSNTLRIAYDNKGQQQIDCISDDIKELTKSITNLKDNSKTKESNFNSENFIYIFLGLALLIIVNKFASKFV